MEFHLRGPENPKNWKSEIRPRGDVLEIGPEWRRLGRPRGRDAEAETARETENLGAWGGESSRGPARVEGGPGSRRGRGGGISAIQFFKKADTEESSWGVRCRPKYNSHQLLKNLIFASILTKAMTTLDGGLVRQGIAKLTARN